jgi:small subunit ribosomal protein S3
MVVERKFVKDRIREHSVKEYLMKYMDNVGFSHIEIQKTPLGYSILIYSSKPGLIVGRKGINIHDIQNTLQKEFKLESPVVEVREVRNSDIDPQIMAEKIGQQLMKFGVARFKAIGHKSIEKMIDSGAVGAEVKIGGKVPSTRARFWKFYGGYLPKCGDVAIKNVEVGYKAVLLKPGIVGVTVKVLPPGLKMPDRVYFIEGKPVVASEEITKKPEEHKEVKEVIEKKEDDKKKRAPRKPRAKKEPKKEEKNNA